MGFTIRICATFIDILEKFQKVYWKGCKSPRHVFKWFKRLKDDCEIFQIKQFLQILQTGKPLKSFLKKLIEYWAIE